MPAWSAVRSCARERIQDRGSFQPRRPRPDATATAIEGSGVWSMSQVYEWQPETLASCSEPVREQSGRNPALGFDPWARTSVGEACAAGSVRDRMFRTGPNNASEVSSREQLGCLGRGEGAGDGSGALGCVLQNGLGGELGRLT